MAEQKEKDGEEAKKCRCQKQKKRIHDAEEAKRRLKQEEMNEEEEEEGSEEGEEVEVEDVSLSDYSSVVSAVPFEWEDKNFEFIDLCDPGTMKNTYERRNWNMTIMVKHYLECWDGMRIPPAFHSIRDKQMKAISPALEQNHIVNTLMLKGNILSDGCCSSLSALLLTITTTIAHLDLSACRTGAQGAELLAKGLKENVMKV